MILSNISILKTLEAEAEPRREDIGNGNELWLIGWLLKINAKKRIKGIYPRTGWYVPLIHTTLE
jgi:hypothetical protein